MSSAQHLARLEISGMSLYFSRIQFPDGWPATVPRLIERPMRAMGTDFERFREDGFVFDPFTAETFESAPTMPTAITLRSNYLAVRRRVGVLVIFRAGVTYRLEHCKVLEVSAPRPIAAITTGFGAGTNDTAAVLAQWTLQFVDVPA